MSNGRFKEKLESDELLEIIFDYAAEITLEHNLDRLLILMANMGRDMTVAERCILWLYDERTDELWAKVAHSMDEVRIPSKAGLAGYVFQTTKPLVIEDAYEDERFRSDVDVKTGYRTKSVMVIPLINKQNKILGVYQVINKLTEEEVFTEQDVKYLSLASSYTAQALEAVLMNIEMEEAQKEIIFKMGEIGEVRSKETGNHVKRVAEYAKLLAIKAGLSEEEADLIRVASPMHDIGKVAIPDAILNKPGRLSKEEYTAIQAHSNIGYDLLKNSNRSILQGAAVIAKQHHERWDGRGYPDGLSGEDIHLYGRIVSVVDVFDALASDRPYKKAWSINRIITHFTKEKGKQFDPVLIDLFLKHLDGFLAIKEQYDDH
ncbi:HD domain-containing phosphohydrolase [Pseudalkalibacillus hwajinpoensis]|uniref:HD domain-containing protein n=1 Tax=Guptibacillus hwajinpoensis TaxID=208199 RepID=A0A4U1MJA8_9BACL|nr:HD domain-containing phosphohydrolase [Pseudalkalibacillus hwajinpoensis]TKD70480.1 HD domain-containing protein [Pseudalkalibacillus hwajinpoensis]